MSVNVYDKSNDKLTQVAGGTLYADAPVGSILPYGGTTAPNGWLLCRGQAVSRVTYSELFAVIGTTYGIGDNSTTFNVPDLREATTKGAGLSGKSGNHYNTTGINVGQFIDDQIKSHPHQVYVRDTGHGHTVNYTNTGQFVPGAYGFVVPMLADTASANAVTNSDIAQIQVNSMPNFTGIANQTHETGLETNEVKAVVVNYIIKAKQTSIPTDFSDSMIGYLGQESNYNLYPWSHEKTVEIADDNQDITIERDGWYSIDYTLSSNADTNHTFTLRDFDSLGEVHTIMRAHYDKRGTFRQTYLVPLKAGTYRYTHGGVGTLSVYMNRRDFA